MKIIFYEHSLILVKRQEIFDCLSFETEDDNIIIKNVFVEQFSCSNSALKSFNQISFINCVLFKDIKTSVFYKFKTINYEGCEFI